MKKHGNGKMCISLKDTNNTSRRFKCTLCNTGYFQAFHFSFVFFSFFAKPFCKVFCPTDEMAATETQQDTSENEQKKNSIDEKSDNDNDESMTEDENNTTNTTTIEKDKPYKCDLCGCSFNNKSHLERHRGGKYCKNNANQNDPLKPYKCLVCERGVQNSNSILFHE